jgi:hypothetical protein
MTYSSSLAVGRQRAMGRNKNVTPFRRNGRTIGPVSNTVILVLLACFLGLLYLSQVTKTNSYGFAINDLEQRQAQLVEEQSELELTAARLQSLDRIQKSSVAQGLVPAQPSSVVQ